MDFIDYRKKLRLGFTDKEKSKLFFTKVFNTLNMIMVQRWANIGVEEYISFCQTTGSQINSHICDNYSFKDRFEACVNIFDNHSKSINEFLCYYMSFVNSLKEERFDEWDRESFISIVEKALTEAHIPFEVLKDKDGYFIFPKGAEELDDALVSEPLEWLNEYPKTRTEFVQALKDYSELNDDNASDVADKFRKALERFFQEFFGKNGTLENLKKEYGTYMKGKGVPAELSNNLEALLQTYTNFMNGYAKHHSKTNKNLLEYILYQTGNIIRLMITLAKEEN